MNTYHSCTAAELREAADQIEALDARDIVGDFRAYEHNCVPGTYVAAILDPKTGDVSHVNEPSRCCSTDEYFGESGLLSRETLLSSTRAHWSPSPDDGFEWTSGENYWGRDRDWFTAEQAEEKAEDLFDEMTFEKAKEYISKGVEMAGKKLVLGDHEQFLRALGWEQFSVSDTPVNGWVPEGWHDYEVKEVTKRLEQLTTDLREKADEIDGEAR